ncbi:MAG: hypothetical protein AAGD01_03370 [Acidobacteriota bacterium]
MSFDLTPNVHIRRDAGGETRQLRHPQEPYRPDQAAADSFTGRQLAAAYLQDTAKIFGFSKEVLSTLDQAVDPNELVQEGDRLRFSEEKLIGNSRVVAFGQTFAGLPVWNCGVGVTLREPEGQVTSAASSFRHDLKVSDLDAERPFDPDQRETLVEWLQKAARRGRGKLLGISSARSVIYRYDPHDLFHHELTLEDLLNLDLNGQQEIEPGRESLYLVGAVPKAVARGEDVVATEVFFTLSIGPWPRLHWRALLHAATGEFLYLRPGVDSIDGQIFRHDPESLAKDATVGACSDVTTVLNPLRETVTLLGLSTPAPGNDQELDGTYITLGEQSSPVVAPPTEPSGTDFLYDADSDDFAAVNAYWHCDDCFRFIDALPGISVNTYMGGTTFPLTTDHRDASLGTVNARAYANTGFNGSGGFGFNLAEATCPVGIAADKRVVWHEICHGLLLDHVNGFNFGFAHSAGDALGVILGDWEAESPDRFETFPFVPLIGRRHDRDVTAGWAWGGTNDVGGYSSESILATTLFRLYRSIGGDATDQSTRELAAKHAAFLIIGAIGTLTSATNPSNPDGFATALMDYDLANDYSGVSRGALHKVVRWAFEEQGLYQPAGAPTPVVTAGDPPDVDVYIDDGRAGTYEYLRNFWSSQDIWNRLAADGGLTHEPPVVGQTNYVYVRVSNRGTQTATNVSVDAYTCVPGTGLVWPSDWQPMTTATATGADIPSGSSTVVGPFEWTPTTVGHECLLAIASATGDLANDTTVTTSIAHNRFVPFDNNIGQRNVAPVPGGGGGGLLLEGFNQQRFRFRNPLRGPGVGKVVPVLPKWLEERGWRLRFPGLNDDNTFRLKARAAREIQLELVPGKDFEPQDIPDAPDQRWIEVHSFVNGVLVGGMTYDVDPQLKEFSFGKTQRGC